MSILIIDSFDIHIVLFFFAFSALGKVLRKAVKVRRMDMFLSVILLIRCPVVAFLTKFRDRIEQFCHPSSKGRALDIIPWC